MGKRHGAATPTVEGELFGLGAITVSPAAQDALAGIGAAWETILTRHGRGDWGNVRSALHLPNRIGLRTKGTVVSSYRIQGHGQALDSVITIETDLRAGETRVLLDEEWRQRHRESRPEQDDPDVQACIEREDLLRTDLERLTAALPTREREEARHAEEIAGAELDRLVVDEATGHATATQVKAAERALQAAASQHATLTRKWQTLDARISTLRGQLDHARQRREDAERRAIETTRARERQLLALIDQYEADAAQARSLFDQLQRSLERVKQRQTALEALDAHPNRHFFSGYGTQLEALMSGTPADETPDAEPWEKP